MPNDNFGVKKLYTDSIKNPMSWHLSTDMDPRLEISGNLASLVKLDDDVFTFEIGNDYGRLNVFTTQYYDSTRVTPDHSQCLTNGFMMSRNDWRNFEATAYINMDALSDNDGFFVRGRGGQHVGTTNCEGFAYIGKLYYDGSVSFSKEQFHKHIDEVIDFTQSDVLGSIENTWIGFKFICYNDRSNKDSVTLEVWVDVNSDNIWTPIATYKDVGNWGDKGLTCNGLTADQIGFWGGPIVTFGWDNCTNMNLKWMSVREIDPFAEMNEAGSNLLGGINVGGSSNSGLGLNTNPNFGTIGLE